MFNKIGQGGDPFFEMAKLVNITPKTSVYETYDMSSYVFFATEGDKPTCMPSCKPMKMWKTAIYRSFS